MISEFMTGVLACAALTLGGIQVWFVWQYRRFTEQVSRDLDEVRLCNDEFAKAITLLKGGNVDEAIAVSTRWHKRAGV